MKVTALFFALLFISIFCRAQNQVILKNGEVIDCKVFSLNGNDLVVTFKGNKIHLKLNDVGSIILDKTLSKTDSIKQTPIKPTLTEYKPNEGKTEPLAAKQGTTEVKPDKGLLKGTVNYYGNDNFSSKPDAGSEVFIYKIEKDPTDSTQAMQVLENLDNGLNKFVNSTAFRSEEMDARAYKSLHDITHDSKNTIKIIVDANGNYQAKLSPGTYEVVIISKGKKGQSKTEQAGRVFAKWLELKGGDIQNISYDFKPY